MLAHAAAFLLLLLGTASASPATGGVQQEPPPPPPPPLEPAALARLQAYLRIDTSQPSPDYEASTAWLLGQAAELGLEATVLRFRPSKPLVLLVWPGADPSLPAVLLNSHTDVVPAEAGRWSHPPFGAHVDPAGRLYARGSQDMKCVGAAYLEAVRRLRGAAPGGAPLLRTLALSFVPDEEIGGKAGMGAFVDSPEFAALNVGVELDEGWASGAGVPTFPAFYAERVPWWFVIRASGEPAHGSVLTDGSAMGRLQGALARVAAFRATQVALVRSGAKQAGEVTSINVVYLRGGVATEAGAPFGEARFAMNVQPGSAEAGLDMRLPPMSAPEMKEAERVLREEWAPAAENLTVEFIIQSRKKTRADGQPVATPIDPAASPWWAAFTASLAAQGLAVAPEVFPAATDASYLRVLGIPAIGFSPLRDTPRLLHDHDEHIGVATYAEAVAVYTRLVADLAGAPAWPGEPRRRQQAGSTAAEEGHGDEL